MRTLAVIAAAFLLVAVSSASAGTRTQVLDLTKAGQFTLDQWDTRLEAYNAQPWDYSQPFIVNPLVGTCSWDINDHREEHAGGTLSAGYLTSTTFCMVSTQNPIRTALNGIYSWWSGPSPWFGASLSIPFPKSSGKVPPTSVSLMACYSPQGVCYSPSPYVDSSSRTPVYRWTMCNRAVYSPGDPALVVVPGSTPDPLPAGASPGYGVVTTITITITNPSGIAWDNSLATFGNTSDQITTTGCDLSRPYDQISHSYPFDWYGS